MKKLKSKHSLPSKYQIQQAYQDACANLRITSKTQKVILITSLQPLEGKTTVALELSEVFQRMGEKVLLMDCDLRRSKMDQYLKIETQPGLVDFLRNEITLDQCIVKDIPQKFDVLFPGEQTIDSTTLLESHEFALMLEELKGTYDRIMIDSPAFNGIADAKILAEVCDGVLLIVEEGRNTMKALKDAKKYMDNHRIVLLGSILTKATLPENLNPILSYYDLKSDRTP